MAVKDWL